VPLSGPLLSGGEPPRSYRESSTTPLEILEELGRGASSVVYRARRDGRDYALKQLRRASTDEDRGWRAFQRESSLLASLSGPGLPRVHEAGVGESGPYLVMDLVEGRRLTEVLVAGPLSMERLVGLATDVASALDAAHGVAVVHRDVKPDNILVTAEGAAFLVDFGFAARVSGPDADHAVGTLRYSAPEQSGMLQRVVDGRSDLYALGVVMYECATGVPPFAGNDAGELLQLHATVPAPDVRVDRPDLPPALARIIAKLLAKDPDERYQSASGVLADLRRLVAGEDFTVAGNDAPAGGRADHRLIGRDVEFRALADRWRLARRGRGGVVLVQGPAGSGKSRLVREVAALAGTDGVVLHGKAGSDDAVPLSPIREAVERYAASVRELPDADRATATARIRDAAGPGAALLAPIGPQLAAVLGATPLRDESRHDHFIVAVATFIAELSRSVGGLVLHLDDAQWFDGATLAVLRHLGAGLADQPTLVLLTARDDAEAETVVAGLRTDLGVTLDLTVTMAPFDVAAVGDLMMSAAGGLAISDDIVENFAARSAGNPFTLLEYLFASIDAGLLRPSWGSWLLDAGGLAELELPHSALDLVRQRVVALDTQSRRVLAVAAVFGPRFSCDTIAAACGMTPTLVRDIVAEAVGRRLLGPDGRGRYAFLHDCIREALLGQLDHDTVAQAHEDIANALDHVGSQDSETVYALARHCKYGLAQDPQRLHRTAYAAGRLALADHLPALAVTYLEQAAAYVTDEDADLYESLGVACHRVGRFADAVTFLRRALAATTAPTRRAAILHLIARVHDSTWDTPAQVAVAREALAELRRPLPANTLLLLVTTFWLFTLGCLIAVTGVGYGTVRGSRRERYRLLTDLHDVAAAGYTRQLKPKVAAVIGLRDMFLANRLGTVAENARTTAGLAYLFRAVGLPRLADRFTERGARLSRATGDPRLIAYAAWLDGLSVQDTGADKGARLLRALDEHGRWLDVGHVLDGLSVLCTDALLRGDLAEARALLARWHAVVQEAGDQLGRNAMHAIEGSVDALRGHLAQAEASLDRLQAAPGKPLWEKVDLVVAMAQRAVESGDDAIGLDRAAADFDSLRLDPRDLFPAQRALFVCFAFGRLAQCRTSGPAELGDRIDAAERAVAVLGKVADRPLLVAYHHVAKAGLLLANGRVGAALAELNRADPVTRRADAPLVAFEIARLRARALRGERTMGESGRQASLALAIAHHHQWPHRARWIITEFGDPYRAGMADHGKAVGSVATAGSDDRDRLAALQQVALAASRVLDPAELIRVAFDETIRILGAERAFLFLAEDNKDVLMPGGGRDAAGNDLRELDAYSTTLVERVRRDRLALVVTGTEEGLALGSESAMHHGLCSMLVAPLQLDGRLLGVVYLDSRIAKGIFTDDDVAMLAAITNYIAVALETVRAAQLQTEVSAARRQRDLAEALSTAMGEISETLVPAEVLGRLLSHAATQMGAAHGWLVLGEPGNDTVRVFSAHQPNTGSASPARDNGWSTVGVDPALALVLAADRPQSGSDFTAEFTSLPARTEAGSSWVCLPLTTRQERLGVLILAGADPAFRSTTWLGTGTVLIEHAMSAYDNARLFAEVQRLASVDALTGIANRGHFLGEAAQSLAVAQHTGQQLIAVMLDIDHFKRVNDTYGHQVGDQVIQTVATRLRQRCREGDLLGRYGGEEFVLLLPGATDPTAAAEALRRTVADTAIDTITGPLPITISVGVSLRRDTDTDLDALLARADAALYQAKRAGRNRVQIDISDVTDAENAVRTAAEAAPGLQC
jgi:diguanylate cyclase (GGDEF)-like protein